MNKTPNIETRADLRGRFRLMLNVQYVHRDKDGNIKLQFNENKLGIAILRFARRFITNPIDEAGQVKKGIFNKIAAYGVRIPFLTGNWQGYRFISNLVTDAGKAGVASRINGSGAEAAFTYIALGTGAVAANAADTTLGAESSASGLARAAATVSRVTTDVANDTARLTNAFSAGASLALTEAGVFNASSAGVLLARQVFSVVNLVSGDTYTPTWNFDVD